MNRYIVISSHTAEDCKRKDDLLACIDPATAAAFSRLGARAAAGSDVPTEQRHDEQQNDRETDHPDEQRPVAARAASLRFLHTPSLAHPPYPYLLVAYMALLKELLAYRIGKLCKPPKWLEHKDVSIFGVRLKSRRRSTRRETSADAQPSGAPWARDTGSRSADRWPRPP